MGPFADVYEKKEYCELTNEEIEEIKNLELSRELYGKNQKIKYISEKVGVYPSAVATVFSEDYRGVPHITQAQGDFEKYRHPSVLREYYFERRMSTEEIADECDCTKGTVQRWMKEHEIEFTNRGKQTWKGTRNWERVADTVRERDGYECQICGFDNGKHKKQFNKQLNVHHVIAETAFETSELAADPQNLITLCQSCHQSHEAMSPRDMFIKAYC